MFNLQQMNLWFLFELAFNSLAYPSIIRRDPAERAMTVGCLWSRTQAEYQWVSGHAALHLSLPKCEPLNTEVVQTLDDLTKAFRSNAFNGFPGEFQSTLPKLRLI